MAQIREFESTTESYFILDGVSYPKVYEAMLDNGYSDTKIKLVGTNRDTTPLVFSTQYTNIRVDGDSFDTALEAISRLNQIVFSKGGGSGTGGATNVITEDSDTVAFTGNGTAGNPLSAESVGGGTTGDYIPLTGTEEGKPVTGPIICSEEFDKEGNRNAFAQISDVEEAVNTIDLSPYAKKDASEMLPANILSWQELVFTTNFLVYIIQQCNDGQKESIRNALNVCICGSVEPGYFSKEFDKYFN